MCRVAWFSPLPEYTSTLVGVFITIHRTLLSLTIDCEANYTQDVAFCDTFQKRLAAVKTFFFVWLVR